jgi:phosphatidylserine decarboxylase
VYENLDDQSLVSVKGVEDSIQNLFNKPIKDFAGGKVAVIRLCPADYHRYHFPCDGEIVEQVSVKGKYHSVNPIALAAQKKIFCLNKRAYTIMDSTLFGRLALMEVGAFGVAGIHQTYSGKNVERMAEKGYFDFGGSTVIVVFPKDSIKFSEDLLENSRQGIETLVKVGETIGGSISS